MAELDQHLPTTSVYHRPTMEEAVVKMKRLQRFTRQFSIFVHCEEDEKTSSKLSPEKEKQHEDENSDSHLFKYPGNLRGIKRKRNIRTTTKTIGVKRKMIEHQKSIREERDPEESTSEIKQDNKKDEMDPKNDLK